MKGLGEIYLGGDMLDVKYLSRVYVYIFLFVIKLGKLNSFWCMVYFLFCIIVDIMV